MNPLNNNPNIPIRREFPHLQTYLKYKWTQWIIYQHIQSCIRRGIFFFIFLIFLFYFFRSWPMCITCTSTLTMGNPSRRLRQAIPSIRKWRTAVSTRLPKSMNQLWTTYLLTRNSWLVSSVQCLMHPSHVQCKRHELNAQINVNIPNGEQEDS